MSVGMVPRIDRAITGGERTARSPLESRASSRARARPSSIAVFATTFLGHQGWMIRSPRACLLVDPLLCEHFGDVHALDYRVYPPRVWCHEALPAVDAVFLSHEHDDHFDVPSLARIDRAIPVYMSAHSSTAAFQILRQMGFVARPLVPGVPVVIEDLQFIPLSGDHASV